MCRKHVIDLYTQIYTRWLRIPSSALTFIRVIIQGQKCVNTHVIRKVVRRHLLSNLSSVSNSCLAADDVTFELQAAFELHHHNSRFKQAFTSQAKECSRDFPGTIKMQQILYTVYVIRFFAKCLKLIIYLFFKFFSHRALYHQ